MIHTLDMLPNILFEVVTEDELFSSLFLIFFVHVNAFFTHVTKTILTTGKARYMTSLSFYLYLEVG